MNKNWPDLMGRPVTDAQIAAVEREAERGGSVMTVPEGMSPTEFSTAITLYRAMMTPKKDVKEAIMKKAMSIVTGSRRSAYGTPEDNFERIARFWQAYFENTGRGDVKITAQDISPLMRLMKEARLCNSASHPDSFTDLVGYALTGAEMNGLKAEDFD